MPAFINNTDLFEQALPESSFNFSAVRPEYLEATEYSLVTIAVDVSGSVDQFAPDLLAALKEAIKACKKSPRAENILLRLITFNQSLTEIHGFLPVEKLDPDSYAMLSCSGSTALFDAAYSALGASRAYGAILARQDYSANGIVFIITDGEDNASNLTPASIRDCGQSLLRQEELDSLVTVLVGINARDSKVALEQFRRDAGLSQFIDMGDVSSAKLARLGGFISRSISTQSQAIGTGQAAPPLGMVF